MNVLTCTFTRLHLNAYVDGRLLPARRRRVATHLDRCEACYARYVQQRELQRDLQRELPLVGQSAMPDFNRLWAGIESQLPAPRAAQPADFQWRHGLVALVLVVLLLLPLGLPHRDRTLALSLPAAPVPEQTAEATPTAHTVVVSAQATAAVSLTLASHYRIATSPPSVPEPQTR